MSAVLLPDQPKSPMLELSLHRKSECVGAMAVALVTGASSGIGFATAVSLARGGHTVIANHAEPEWSRRTTEDRDGRETTLACAFVRRSGGPVRGQRGQANPLHTPEAQTGLKRFEEESGDATATKRGQHADVGYTAKTVRVWRFLNHVLLSNPSSRKAREDATGLGHENSAVARRLSERPDEVRVGGLLAR
jgi:hypothetical protein